MTSILNAELRLLLREWPSLLISVIAWNAMIWGLPYVQRVGDLPFLCAAYYAICVTTLGMHGCARIIDQAKLYEIRMERGLPFAACLAPIVAQLAAYQLSLAPAAIVCAQLSKMSMALWLIIWLCASGLLVAAFAMSEMILLHLLARQLQAAASAFIGGAAAIFIVAAGCAVAFTAFYLPVLVAPPHGRVSQIVALILISAIPALAFVLLLYHASRRLPRRRLSSAIASS